MTLYDVIGVPPTASTDDIKAVYRARIIACHPDRNPTANATETAALLNEAWSVLGDPEQRRAYDAYLADAATRGTDARSSTTPQPAAGTPTAVEQTGTQSDRTAWTCERCGRLVPRYVDKCRCGQTRPTMNTNPVPPRKEARTGSRVKESLVGFLLLILIRACVAWTSNSVTQHVEPAPVVQQPRAADVLPPRPTAPTTRYSNTSDDGVSAREQRELEQRRWEERQQHEIASAPRESAPAPTPAPAATPSPAPSPSPAASRTATPGDTMKEDAERMFAPTLAALSRRADTLNANLRRYLDGCYAKRTRATSSGVSLGVGSADTVGVGVGSRGAFAWETATDFAWQESWAAESNIDNETTARCRILWSDIADDAGVIRGTLAEIDDDGRRAGIYPGVIRDLRFRYGFSR